MRLWQGLALASTIYIIGCAGFGAYVPDETAVSGTPSGCADLSIQMPSALTINDVNTVNFDVFVQNGEVQGLQSRAPGDATYTISVSGSPSDVSESITPSSATVLLNNSVSHQLSLDADSADLGTYNLTVTVTETGCTSIVRIVSVTIESGSSTSIINDMNRVDI